MKRTKSVSIIFHCGGGGIVWLGFEAWGGGEEREIDSGGGGVGGYGRDGD